MNKIYKVIWSSVQQAFIVVSELTKAHGKSKSQLEQHIDLAKQDLVSLNHTSNSPTKISYTYSLVFLAVSSALSSLAHAVGAGTTISGNAVDSNTQNSVIIGNTTTVSSANSTQNSVVVGNDITKILADQITALGNNTSVTVEGGVAVGANSVSSTKKDSSIYIPNLYTNFSSNELAYFEQKFTELDPSLSGTLTSKNDVFAKIVQAYKLKGYTIFNFIHSNSFADLQNGNLSYEVAKFLSEISVRDNHIVINGLDLPTAGAFAVGDPKNNVLRQITGLAAGSEDTDAVNVGQLKLAQMHYVSVAPGSNSRSSESNYNNDGAIAQR